jgi:hypothetical protein
MLPLALPAQERQFERERGGLLLGAFITDRATSARLDSGQGSGSDISFEDDLGLESSTSVFRFGGYYWFTPRQRFDFSVFDLSRDASRRIDETIDFGDQTFLINTVVMSETTCPSPSSITRSRPSVVSVDTWELRRGSTSPPRN